MTVLCHLEIQMIRHKSIYLDGNKIEDIDIEKTLIVISFKTELDSN